MSQHRGRKAKVSARPTRQRPRQEVSQVAGQEKPEKKNQGWARERARLAKPGLEDGLPRQTDWSPRLQSWAKNRFWLAALGSETERTRLSGAKGAAGDHRTGRFAFDAALDHDTPIPLHVPVTRLCNAAPCYGGKRMTSYTVGQAARLTGKSKPTITRAIKAGILSAVRNDNGSYSIDAAELSRVFVLSAESDVILSGNTNRNMTRSETLDEPTVLQRENEPAGNVGRAQRSVGDLRVRLDEERADRRQALDRLAAAQERIAALLTDQRQATPNPPSTKKRRWWSWRS